MGICSTNNHLLVLSNALSKYRITEMPNKIHFVRTRINVEIEVRKNGRCNDNRHVKMLENVF